MKKSYLQTALLLALAGQVIAIENMIPYAGFTETIDSTAAEGTFTDAAGAVLTSATADPYYLVVDANLANDSQRTVCRPGFPGIVEAKLHSAAGTIVKGSKLILHTDGTVKLDPGTGTRLVVAVAQEAKVSDGQLLKVRLLGTPQLF